MWPRSAEIEGVRRPGAARQLPEEGADDRRKARGGKVEKRPAPRRTDRDAAAVPKRLDRLVLGGDAELVERRGPSLAALRRQRERERRQASGAAEFVVREVVLPETITVQDLAARMAIRGAEVVKVLMKNGILATINQSLDPDTAELVVCSRPLECIAGRTLVRYSRGAVKKQLAQQRDRPKILLDLLREGDPEVSYEMSFVKEGDIRFWLDIIIPFACFVEPESAAPHSATVVSLVKALVAACAPVYGYAHSKGDLSLGSDPHRGDPFAAKQVYEAYWLSVYGASMVAQLGREWLLQTPASLVEELPHDAILVLTRPTPADFNTPVAREAQARALTHLRSDLKFESVLQQLRARSAQLAPAQRAWDADVADLLELTLDSVSFADRERRAESLNKYRPPEVSEQKDVADLKPADVDESESIAAYEGYAERLVALLHKDVPQAMTADPQVLPRVDYHFWHFDYPATFSRTDIDNDLVPAIGAYLGEMLVNHLGGKWVPRRNLDESQIVISGRVWLPFLRARHYMRDKQAVLDYSLTQFYRVAARMSGPPRHMTSNM